MIKRIRIPVLLLGMMILAACSSLYTTSGSRWNLGEIYNPASSQLHPSYRVYHHMDDRSILLVKLFPSELLFNQANESGVFMSKVSVQLQAYEIRENNPILVDSITYTYDIRQENVGRRFLTQIPFKAETGKRYQLRVVARDLIRKDFNLQFVDVDKTSPYSPQNFNLVNEQRIPYFNNVLLPNAVYKIEHRNPVHDTLYIHYYSSQLPIPSPVYPSVSDESFYQKADSVYALPYSPNLLLSFAYEGIYHFRFDTTLSEGLTVVNFGANFPKIKSPEELIEPLAYIATTVDYEQLLKEENKKLANDRFWLKLAETTGRARELIRVYYNRVYFANYYFSTSVPGWKTDRGMVYVIYGPPRNMEKTPTTESWIYNIGGASGSITFNFRNNPTAFNPENYQLIRSESQNWRWKEAVESWRSGKIFMAD
ncbi:MAG: GWxTD domain-containing protein [Bacteroidales bacterium]|nr:GWxTD domain-containing protein [Bacteroidales bacterium]